MQTSESNDMTTATTLKLQVENIHKRFGSNEVLKGVSLTAHAGDVILSLIHI